MGREGVVVDGVGIAFNQFLNMYLYSQASVIIFIHRL